MVNQVFSTIIPGWKGAGIPRQFPWHVRWFLLASLQVVTLCSLWWFRRSFKQLNEQQREQVLQRMYDHHRPAIRSLIQFWKLTAFMTYDY